MTKKISNMLAKLPMAVIIIIDVVIAGIVGVFTSLVNENTSKITQVFSIELLRNIVISMLVWEVFVLLEKVIIKALRIKILNQQYMTWYKKVAASNVAEIQSTSTGKIFDSVKDIAGFTADIVNDIINVIPVLIPFSTMVYKLGQKSVIAVVVTISCIIATTVLILISDKIFKFDSEGSKFKAQMASCSVDIFMNMKTLKYLNKTSWGEELQMEQQTLTQPYFVNVGKIVYHRLTTLLMSVPLIVNILIADGDMSLIAVIVVNDYLVHNLTGYFINISDAIVERQSKVKVLKDLKGDDTSDGIDMPETLELNDVEFDYGKDSTHFYVESLRFERGHRYHVTGESGQGKSSLANLLVGAIKPTNCEIEKIKTFYVYQETECFNQSLRENIRFGNENISDTEIISLMKELRMIDWFESLNDGLDTIIGEKGCKLSSGLKQRVNIIRTILRMREHLNEFIILDEITSNLDAETERVAIKMIDRECKGGTMMIISHHGGFNEICDSHITVENHKFYQSEYNNTFVKNIAQ